MPAVKFDPGKIIRDRWDRPLIQGQPYTRASTLSLSIESTFGLDEWKRNQVAIGMSLREDLRALALSSQSKEDLTQVVKSAMDAADSRRGANIGTAIHSVTEQWDLGKGIPKGLSTPMVKCVEAYKEVTKFLTPKIAETFICCDEIMTAGTFDRIVEYKGNLYIADLKTGNDAPKYSHGASVQLAVYSRGTPIVNGERYPRSLLEMGVNQNNAIMIHVPQDNPEKSALYWVDIKTGWSMAKVAANVRLWWKSKPVKPLL